MVLFKTIQALNKKLDKIRSSKSTIGFVPTMGALHDGHLSLIKSCKEKYDITVCSIFVNPTQFTNKTDFEKYPVTVENDIFLLETNKTDILFMPPVAEIYPHGLQQQINFKLGYLENILEGKFRPGHFQGVCNIVFRLLEIIQPDGIFLGKKDYQQFLVLQKMMQEFFAGIKINLVDIMREKNGLAMSSRNMRLSAAARQNAVTVYECLQFIKENIFKIPVDELKKKAAEKLLKRGFEKVDYVEICDAETLLPVFVAIKNKKLIALAAASIEEVRLIDNILIN